jgi:hypothetical protein
MCSKTECQALLPKFLVLRTNIEQWPSQADDPCKENTSSRNINGPSRGKQLDGHDRFYKIQAVGLLVDFSTCADRQVDGCAPERLESATTTAAEASARVAASTAEA